MIRTQVHGTCLPLSLVPTVPVVAYLAAAPAWQPGRDRQLTLALPGNEH